ncbi:MAG TPA: substrate-binding domain-containing protein [Roseiflexaceae bacterium]|nr:substrate-binding domain-containing protein [Roseiflexaceae bacterium]
MLFASGGTVRVGGSSALWPLLEEAAVRYQAQNPGVTIAVARSSSGNGRRGVCGGQLDIGASDIPLSAEEQAQLRCEDVRQTPIAIQAFVPIAHTRGPGALTSLTKAQLVGIFSGSVTNWQEVGGENQRIVVVNRVPSSGTRANMAAFLFDGDNSRFTEGEAQEESSGIEQLVSQTPGAISYVSLAYLGNPNIRPIGIDGVLPNRESIQSGQWPIGGPGYVIPRVRCPAPPRALSRFSRAPSSRAVRSTPGWGLCRRRAANTKRRWVPTMFLHWANIVGPG